MRIRMILFFVFFYSIDFDLISLIFSHIFKIHTVSRWLRDPTTRRGRGGKLRRTLYPRFFRADGDVRDVARPVRRRVADTVRGQTTGGGGRRSVATKRRQRQSVLRGDGPVEHEST